MNPWYYEPADDLNQSLIERLRKFPREPDMLVYGMRSFIALLIRGWIRAYHRFTIVGSENLPKEGSFVLVANHASHLDALCLLAALPLRRLHRVFPVAAADYFFTSVPRIWMATVVVNALPFEREVHCGQSLALCDQLLKNPGNVLIIFPEGTRSPTGDIGRFKPGIGTLLAGCAVPVIPCFLGGTFRAWPKGRSFPWPTKITLRIGAPKNYAHLHPGRESGYAIADELQAAVQEIKDLYENG
jgi:1-acyl-sn-glycerol-3-phosphate acyltransferase